MFCIFRWMKNFWKTLMHPDVCKLCWNRGIRKVPFGRRSNCIDPKMHALDESIYVKSAHRGKMPGNYKHTVAAHWDDFICGNLYGKGFWLGSFHCQEIERKNKVIRYHAGHSMDLNGICKHPWLVAERLLKKSRRLMVLDVLLKPAKEWEEKIGKRYFS